jgi:hypothetical protein
VAIMDLVRPLWSRRTEAPESNHEVSLDEFLRDYDIVEVNDEPGKQFAIVTPRAVPVGDTTELGSSSPTPWLSFNRKEYNPKLAGKHGLEAFDKMRKSDGTVRGTLRVYKTPVLSAQWYIEPGGKKLKDRRAAEFIWKNLTELMSISWTQVLTESMLMVDFGYYMFEKVYEERVVDGKLRTVWKKLAPRHPMDVESWVLDANGGPMGAWFYASAEDASSWRDEYMVGKQETQTSNMPGQSNRPVQTVSGIPNIENVNDHPYSIFIPIDKLVVFTFDKESGNIEGTSALRSAYKHWYYKEQLYKIDAIQKERHGIGIPVVKLPVGYKAEDKTAADNLGRNIRTNERAHITLPPGWEIFMLKLEGNPVDCLPSIEHHDSLIEKNIAGHFLKTGRDLDLDMFLKSSRFMADIVSETFNMYCIPQLSLYNFPGAAIPKLKYRHIGESVDWRTMSFAIRNFIGAGVIRPDDPMEENIREGLGLPRMDPTTARNVLTPQAGPAGSRPQDQPDDDDDGNGGQRPPAPPAPPRTGPPRQAPVGRQRNTQGLPQRDAGRDNSGGR